MNPIQAQQMVQVPLLAHTREWWSGEERRNITFEFHQAMEIDKQWVLKVFLQNRETDHPNISISHFRLPLNFDTRQIPAALHLLRSLTIESVKRNQITFFAEPNLAQLVSV